MSNTTQAERISSLEMEVSYLRLEVSEMNKNINELLALRNKGAGVFWLASVLFGASVFGAAAFIMSLFKGS